MKHIEVASIFLVEIQLFKTCSLEYRNSGTVTFPLVNQLAYKIFVKPVNLSDNLIYLYTYIYIHTYYLLMSCRALKTTKQFLTCRFLCVVCKFEYPNGNNDCCFDDSPESLVRTYEAHVIFQCQKGLSGHKLSMIFYQLLLLHYFYFQSLYSW